MVAATSTRHRIDTKHLKYPKSQNEHGSAINHAVRLIHAVCGLAGSATWIDDIRADLRADKVQAAIRHRDTAVVFDWLTNGRSELSRHRRSGRLRLHGAAWPGGVARHRPEAQPGCQLPQAQLLLPLQCLPIRKG